MGCQMWGKRVKARWHRRTNQMLNCSTEQKAWITWDFPLEDGMLLGLLKTGKIKSEQRQRKWEWSRQAEKAKKVMSNWFQSSPGSQTDGTPTRNKHDAKLTKFLGFLFSDILESFAMSDCCLFACQFAHPTQMLLIASSKVMVKKHTMSACTRILCL